MAGIKFISIVHYTCTLHLSSLNLLTNLRMESKYIKTPENNIIQKKTLVFLYEIQEMKKVMPREFPDNNHTI
jgi:hypothetical protein